MLEQKASVETQRAWADGRFPLALMAGELSLAKRKLEHHLHAKKGAIKHFGDEDPLAAEALSGGWDCGGQGQR